MAYSILVSSVMRVQIIPIPTPMCVARIVPGLAAETLSVTATKSVMMAIAPIAMVAISTVTVKRTRLQRRR